MGGALHPISGLLTRRGNSARTEAARNHRSPPVADLCQKNRFPPCGSSGGGARQPMGASSAGSTPFPRLQIANGEAGPGTGWPDMSLHEGEAPQNQVFGIRLRLLVPGEIPLCDSQSFRPMRLEHRRDSEPINYTYMRAACRHQPGPRHSPSLDLCEMDTVTRNNRSGADSMSGDLSL